MDVDRHNDLYGYIDVWLTIPEMADFYTHSDINIAGTLTNQYLLLYSKESGELADKLLWNGSEYVKVKYKPIENEYSGKIRPRNTNQQLAFNLLQNRSATVKVLHGVAGSGKDIMMTSHALDLIESGVFQKIVLVRNNVEVKDSRPIGFIPGGTNDKLLPFAMQFADHVGGVEALEGLLRSHTVEIIHLGFLRGRDLRDSIIICSEAENLTQDHIKLLLGRVGEGSELWLNGDDSQTDLVRCADTGMRAAIDRLGGNKLFGCVYLDKVERSETAALSDLF